MKQVVQLLRSKIIPWTAPGSTRRLIVARPEMRAGDLPDGVTLSRRKLGERVIFRGLRRHGNQRLHIAHWPDNNLLEITVPKIVCVVHGIADFLVSKYSVQCGEGYFHIVPPEMPHQNLGPFLNASRLRTGDCTLVHAYAYSQGILFWHTTSREGQHINNQADNYLISNIALAQLLTQAVEEAVADQTDAELICNNCLSAFFAIAAREIEAGNYVSLGPGENLRMAKSAGTSFTEQVKEYIEANCNKRLTVKEVARHMYMSDSHFFRQMHKNGLNFTQLLTHYRMELACHLLRNTDLTTMAIASLVSYRSPTYLQNLFRTHMGCSPIEYRYNSRKTTSKNK